MKPLIFFGASNFGDEIVQCVRDYNASFPASAYEIIGFLDDNSEVTGVIRNGVPVLGTRQWLDTHDATDYQFLVCIGNPRVKKLIAEWITYKGGSFATVIHPSVIQSPFNKIGVGTMITAGNILTTNVKVGNHVIVNLACTVGHYTEIGDFSTINPGCNVSGDVKLGEGAYLGTNCTILEKRIVGSYAVIGAGAVVKSDIPEACTAVGIPARVIKGN